MRRLAVLLAALAAAAFAVAPGASAAVWCGTDQTAGDRPDVSTGAQLHLIYAYPSDGGDSFPTFANEIATDVETADAWWRGQDPTRTPRFDFAALPGCTGLDLGVVQLGLTSAQLAPSRGRYSAIFRALPRFDRWKTVVVYYDGPVDELSLCGTGGGSTTTGSDSLAIVFVRSSCARSPSLRAAVLVHELTHELGAPDGRERHPCPGDTGHVCDTDLDLMYPFLSVDSIDELVLDAGRDDYYREGGTAFDLSTSQWLRHLEAPQQALSVSVAGGAGTVRSDLPGIACEQACTSQWDVGTRVTLAPEPAAGQRFVGWKGDCSGVLCAVTLTAPASVQAVFGPSTVRLTARVSGRGRVVGRGIACPPSCSAAVNVDGPLTLAVEPARGWRFAGWTGACRGTKLCRIVPQAAVAVRARFVRR
jgi:hypothetical protein